MFGLGLRVVNPIAVLAVTEDDYFALRVAADGGIMEAFGCVVEAILNFPPADIGRLVYEPYAARVVADGGILEAQACTINDINNLIQ